MKVYWVTPGRGKRFTGVPLQVRVVLFNCVVFQVHVSRRNAMASVFGFGVAVGWKSRMRVEEKRG